MGQNLDRIRERHAGLQTFGEGGGGVEYLKLQPGSNIIRLLPPFAPREDFWIERRVRFDVGPNKKKIFSPLDASAPDPAKDEYNRLLALADDASKRRANDMREKKRALMWAIDRGHPEMGYQLFDTNLFVLRDILAIFMDSDYGDITNADTGCDITINYTAGIKGKSFPQWQVVPRRNSTPLGHPEFLTEDLFEKHRIGNPSDLDYVQACLQGSEKAYLEAKKAERDAAKATGGDGAPQTTEITETPSPAPAQNEDAAVQQELDRLRAVKAAAPPPPPPSAGTPANLTAAQGWYATGIDGNAAAQAVDSATIQKLVDAGNGNVLICHGELTGNAWKAATEVGFVAAAGAAAPPPPPSQVGADLEAALG